MTRHLRIALIAILLSAPAASAQSLPEGITMHRQMAGELDASGWTSADSTQGGFSVRIPLKFNDFTVASPPSNKQVAMTYVVGGKNAGGVKYSAVRVAYRNKEAAKAYFARFERGEAFAGMGALAKPHRFQGRKAVDLAVKKDRRHGFMRYVLLDDSLIFLVVEAEADKSHMIHATKVETFFDSLKVSRP